MQAPPCHGLCSISIWVSGESRLAWVQRRPVFPDPQSATMPDLHGVQICLTAGDGEVLRRLPPQDTVVCESEPEPACLPVFFRLSSPFLSSSRSPGNRSLACLLAWNRDSMVFAGNAFLTGCQEVRFNCGLERQFPVGL